MNPSPNLFLIGPMGAGKTSIGRRLARRFELRFIDLDQALETRTGASIPLIFDIEGEVGFRQRETDLLKEFSSEHGILLATGGGIVLSQDNRRLLGGNGFVVYLRTRVEHQLQRLRRDRQRPLLAAPDREQRLHALAREREPLYAALADLEIAPRQEPVARASERIGREIENHWQRAGGDSQAA